MKDSLLNTIRITVNGQKHEASIDARRTLLDFIRDTLNLTGTKKGCDHGQCGACTVIVNGRRINSCLSLALSHDGDHVTTVEGLADGDEPHPLQRAFIEHDAFQCGFCTPGQLCSAAALLDELREGLPSAVSCSQAAFAEEVRERMSGNLCRCGAYNNIVDAIAAVAGERR